VQKVSILILVAIVLSALIPLNADVSLADCAKSCDSNKYAQLNIPAPPPQTARRIVSWNIENLGTRDPRRTQQQITAIAQRILTFDASVLLVQEIFDDSLLEQIRSYLGPSWEMYYSGMENALLYDESKVELLSSEILVSLQNPPYTLYPGRDFSKPVSGVFRPVRMYAEPFRVIGIHCYHADAGVRTAEGNWLRARIIELLDTPGESRDIILMGDHNGSPGSPPHPALQQGNILHLLPKQNGDVTDVSGRQIDHCYVTQSAKGKIPSQSTFVIRPEHYGETNDQFRATYSDHYPIYVDFRPDAHTDLADLAGFVAQWLQTGCDLQNKWCSSADLGGDGNVNLTDFALFAEHWLPGAPPLPEQATNPNPLDKATGIAATADLSWTPGLYATSHDVYFGTTNPPPFIGNQTATTFDPGTMAFSTKHYWRIDQVNSSGKTTGILWSFTTELGPPPL